MSARLRLVAIPTPQIAIMPMADMVRKPDSSIPAFASVLLATLSITACVAALFWAVFVSIFP